MSNLISVIEDFSSWNEWYQNQRVRLIDLGGHYNQNSFVILKSGDGFDYGMVKGDWLVRVKQDYSPCNISPRNIEQLFALQMLKDKTVPLKILSGSAGSGKTLLACAHAIQKLNSPSQGVSKVVIAKSMTPVGREIGFLKGGLEEKITPWLGPFYDNLIHCGYEAADIAQLTESGALEITPITFIQGRSIANAVIIIDEVQNLDLNIVKQIITRAAENTEIILLGDQSQVFERSVRDRTIDVLMERSFGSEIVGVMELKETVRSRLADWGVRNL